MAKLRNQRGQTVQRDDESFTLSNLATIYGCCGLFDLCTDQDLMSLSFEGTSKFLDWIGWEATDVCRIKKAFISYVRPEQANGACTPGYRADPCSDSNSVEFGVCDFTLEDFGRLSRATPVRDITKVGLRLCDRQPRYRLDGSPITDDLEFDLRIVTEAILQDLKRYIITGQRTTAGLFDGLQALVNTGYVNFDGRHCQAMDANVINWNANGMNGGAGITWNGTAQPTGYNLVDYILAVYRRIRQRIDWAPALASQGLTVGDMVIVGTTQFIQCLLDAYTCWSVCPTTADVTAFLSTYEGRTFRDKHNGGMFGDGWITLDGFDIPCIAYDWELQNGPTLSDFYFLTGQVGAVKLINGQYNDMKSVPAKDSKFAYTDGGRLLTWLEHDNTCVERNVEMQPRLLMWAPWAQARFHDVRCVRPGGVIGPDPCDTSFFPLSSFHAAACPPSERGERET